MGTSLSGVVSQRLWLKFCRIAGLEYLIDDPRFADNAARKAHESELAGIIDAVTREAHAVGMACRVRGGRNSGRADQRLRPGRSPIHRLGPTGWYKRSIRRYPAARG